MGTRRKIFRTISGLRLRSVVRRAARGGAILAIGIAIGIGASGTWDLPSQLGLLATALFREAEHEVVLGDPGPPVTASSLAEFKRLQRPSEETPSKPSHTRVVAKPVPAPASLPAVAAPASDHPGEEASVHVEESATARLLRKIQERRALEHEASLRTGTVVQVASYRDARSADALARRLRSQGFDSFVEENEADLNPRFRVRVQPKVGSNGEKVAEQLSQLGFSVWVTRQ